MKIFEKLGVTENTESLIESIYEDILYYYKTFGNKHLTFQIVDKEKEDRYIDLKHKDYYDIISFYINDKENTLDFISNESIIKLNIVYCNNIEDYHIYKRNNKFKISIASIKLSELGIISEINLTIFDINGKPLFNNKELSLDNFYPIMQHEINHIHKRIEFFNNKDFDNLYSELMQFKNGNSVISYISHYLYKYCIGDERNAHIEQFYREVKDKDPKTSNIYNEIKTDKKILVSFNKPVYINAIYKNKDFVDFCNRMFSIKKNNAEDFCKTLFEFIEKKMNITRKKMLRTLSLYESLEEKNNRSTYRKYYFDEGIYPPNVNIDEIIKRISIE